MPDNKRVHVIISGRVQGVCFRIETARAVEKIGDITGWVKNNPDNTVEAVFEGEENEIKEILRWCNSGPPLARVDDLSIRQETYKNEFLQFKITG